jgi:glucose/arabinose dehydrogenase
MATLTPFGSTNAGLNPNYDERGLLGLTFHPDYASNGRFFVYYSSPKSAPGVDHESVLATYSVSTNNPNLADPSSAQILLRVDQPEFNHNGGTLAFGPDRYLYLALGDGGGGGDLHGPYGNAQNLSNLLGKILRIDVDSAPPYAIPPDNPFAATPGADEIFAFGFRNPWKFSFDRGGSNALWVADVGQQLWEEINDVRLGGNYGWRILEGHHAYDPTVATTVGVAIATLDAPLHEYRHGPLGISIIGGAVYRGPLYPELVGRYVFGDFSTSFGAPDGALFYLQESRPGIWQRFTFELPGSTRLNRYVKGFGEDELGNLYLLSTTRLGPSGSSGDVRRLRKP